MTNTDKSLETITSHRLYRSEQVLENKEDSLIVVAPVDEDNLKQPQISEGETGGPKGPDPTRYGDWERNGRCIDF